MKKPLFLALTLLALLVISATAYAASVGQSMARPPGLQPGAAEQIAERRNWLRQNALTSGKIEGVDYTRLNNGGGIPFTLRVGKLFFEGGRIGSGEKLTDEELNKLLKSILNSKDFPLNEGEFANAQAVLDWAENVEGLGMEDVQTGILKALGVDTLAEAILHLMGHSKMSKSQIATQFAGDYAKDVAGDVAAGALGLGKIGGKLLTTLPELLDFGLETYHKYQDKQAALALALTRKALVDSFYDIADAKIEEALRKKSGAARGEKFLILDGATAKIADVTFWGMTGLVAEWQADMKLARQSQRDGPDGVRGLYSGNLNLRLIRLVGFNQEELAKNNPAIVELNRMFILSAGIIANMKYEITGNAGNEPKYSATAPVRVDLMTRVAALSGAFAGGKGDLGLNITLAGRGLTVTGATRNSTVVAFTLHSEGTNALRLKMLSCLTTSVTPYAGSDSFNFLKGWSGMTVPMDMGNLLEPLQGEKTITVEGL